MMINNKISNKRSFNQFNGFIVFIKLLFAFNLAIVGQLYADTIPDGTIMTVTGPISPDQMGITLTHEHILVDFIGVEKVSKDRYDPEEVFKVAMPFLKQVSELGCKTFFECTPAYLGRDPVILKKLSEATGLNIITCTGYYGARKNNHLPAHAFSENANQLADRWVEEWMNGIENTGIRPGFIKIGVDTGSLSDVHRKLVEAAARAHLKTGLTIVSHTGPATTAFNELEVLKKEGVDPQAFIWIHAQIEKKLNNHIKAAKLGAWISFDGLGPGKTKQYVELISNMKEHGLLNHVLLSHDAGWYHVGEAGGGDFRVFEQIFIELLPALKSEGFSEEEIEQLIIVNPRNAFMIKVRAAR